MQVRVQQLLDTVAITEPIAVDGLQILGLRWEADTDLAYVTLNEALALDSFEVTEIGEAGSITIYYGNSEDALGPSDLLLFYRNSLVVFETQATTAGAEKTYQSRVILRRDFGSNAVAEVKR